MRKLLIGGRPLLHPAHKALVVGLFLVTLYVWSSFTWVGLVTVDRAITRTSDRLSVMAFGESLPTDKLLSKDDLSRLHFSTSPDLYVLVTFPDGRKVGQLNEDVLLQEVPEAKVEKLMARREALISLGTTSTPRWVLETPQPPNGHYSIYVTSTKGGRFILSVQADDKANFYSKRFDLPIELAPASNKTLVLNFHKESVKRSNLYEDTGWFGL